MNHKNQFLESLRGGVESDYAHGDPQLSFAFLPAGEEASFLRAETVYYSASTVKVGVLVAVLREIAAGNLRFDQHLTVTHTFESVAPGGGSFVMEDEETDPGMGEVGSWCTLEHALTRMITVSANCATNMLFALVGAEKIQQVFVDAGASDCAMRRPYSDSAGLVAGVTNSASAAGLARFWLALGEGRLLPAELTEYAIQLCARVTEPVLADGIRSAAMRAGISPEQILIASKPGSVTGIEHDAALIRWGQKQAALAVCTSGMTEEEGHAAIRAAAEAIFNSWAGFTNKQAASPKTAERVTVRYALLACSGQEHSRQGYLAAARAEETSCYAASTVKLALAAAVLREIKQGQLALTEKVTVRRKFYSRMQGAPMFTVPLPDADVGMPLDGEPITIKDLLWRMLAISSNEATNILLEELGAARMLGLPATKAEKVTAETGREQVLLGLAGIQETLAEFVLHGYSAAGTLVFSRPICDSAARPYGFTHSATPLGLAELLWGILCGDVLHPDSRQLVWRMLRDQRFGFALADADKKVIWGSKSGWDEGVLHDVVACGNPDSDDFKVLALMTEGMGAAAAQVTMQMLAAVLLR